jgi:hypothetical protein
MTLVWCIVGVGVFIAGDAGKRSAVSFQRSVPMRDSCHIEDFGIHALMGAVGEGRELAVAFGGPGSGAADEI